ncbi:MAG TPA: hypothetical protein VK892_17165 [Pyrinomonadaceae bacterium]|nr:hypothetical protein [Pyrinomonadaceae bacterium]
MKSAKIFIVFTFLLFFAIQVSAQDEKPKIVWKNLQEKYESFYDIKPIIVNESDQPVYFNCSTNEYGTFPAYGYYLNFKMLLNNVESRWDWNVFACGTKTEKEIKELEKQNRRKEKLIKQGKYIPDGCRLDPNQEFTIKFSQELWNGIIGKSGDPYAHYIYQSGKYKFVLEYEWANAQHPVISESPEFVVNLKEETR